MFAEPISLSSIDGTVYALTRINSDKGFSEYRYTDAIREIRMFIRNVELKKDPDGRQRHRHIISISFRVFATPGVPEILRESSHSVTHYRGDTIASWGAVAKAVANTVNDITLGKLANFES